MKLQHMGLGVLEDGKGQLRGNVHTYGPFRHVDLEQIVRPLTQFSEVSVVRVPTGREMFSRETDILVFGFIHSERPVAVKKVNKTNKLKYR